MICILSCLGVMFLRYKFDLMIVLFQVLFCIPGIQAHVFNFLYIVLFYIPTDILFTYFISY